MSFKVLAMSSTRPDIDWIQDLGCSFHMSPFRHWFNDFKDFANGRVLLGDDYEYQVKGIYFVKLSLPNGTFRILSDVRYIPKLRRNLIFLGILDALRYSIKIDNNLIKVIKGYLIAMKVVKVSGLYVLHGITLDGKGTTSVVQSLDSAML